MSQTPSTPADSRPQDTPKAPPVSGGLAALKTLKTFQQANRHVFASVPSLRWFVRRNRADLVAAGAVVEIAGRVMINAPVFSQAAIEIGAKRADARTHRLAESAAGG